MAKGRYTKTERSTAARKGWRDRKSRFWITGGVKPINTVPVGKVKVLVSE